jgi:hypothetical protein
MIGFDDLVNGLAIAELPDFLDIGEVWFDQAEVGAVGRQEEQGCPCRLDQSAGFIGLVELGIRPLSKLFS